MEFASLKMWLCIAVSVSSFVVLTTAQSVTPEATEAPDGPVSHEDLESHEEVIIGIGNKDVECYTCDNEHDNDECNGANLGENGTKVHCTYEQSNCFSILKINAAGDGYTVQKGCMDFDECYDKHYEQSNDPIRAGDCLRINLLGDDPIPANTECFYCCYAFDGVSLSMCNKVMGKEYLALPEPNNWDPAVDKWPGHESGEITEEPAITAGAESATLPLGTIFILMSALFV